jgi:hypothetical protein
MFWAKIEVHGSSRWTRSVRPGTDFQHIPGFCFFSDNANSIIASRVFILDFHLDVTLFSKVVSEALDEFHEFHGSSRWTKDAGLRPSWFDASGSRNKLRP